MKILHTVQGYFPFVGGSEELVRKISEGLVKKGHEVTVFTSYNKKRNFTSLNGVKIQQFDIKGNLVRGIKGRDIQKYIDAVLNGNFDIMMNYAAQSWNLDLLIPVINRIKYIKILAPVGYSELHNSNYANYFNELPKTLKQYDHIIYHSSIYQDKQFGDNNNLKNYSIIPNFADENEFSENRIDFKKKYDIRTKYLFLNVSNHYKDKGHSFTIDAFNKAKIPDSTLVVIGNKTKFFYPISDCYYNCKLSEKFSHGRIRIINNIPRVDTIGAFKSADLFLFGSKVECSPLVIFEAMASKTPWISTKVGNVEELKGGCIIHNTEQMAQYIKELINDNKLYSKKRNEGYITWKSNYSLEYIIQKYESLYHEQLKL